MRIFQSGLCAVIFLLYPINSRLVETPENTVSGMIVHVVICNLHLTTHIKTQLIHSLVLLRLIRMQTATTLNFSSSLLQRSVEAGSGSDRGWVRTRRTLSGAVEQSVGPRNSEGNQFLVREKFRPFSSSIFRPPQTLSERIFQSHHSVFELRGVIHALVVVLFSC